ncbi:MAG: hypothetical protein PHC28_12510 [Flavobacterium sp.]|uniref:hypothetical protein n=1 Tax=Flavobacterium sp. TaxID=239 RepID=UPI002632EEA8|nr:hypothetical protein [Flavobacterium sp.]MDD5151274.1 hypothetical protein [Flavobacterium sp.]
MSRTFRERSIGSVEYFNDTFKNIDKEVALYYSDNDKYRYKFKVWFKSPKKPIMKVSTKNLLDEYYDDLEENIRISSSYEEDEYYDIDYDPYFREPKVKEIEYPDDFIYDQDCVYIEFDSIWD